MQKKSQAVVRAIDVGYGHVKWTDGRDDANQIISDTFPSQAPVIFEGEWTSTVFHKHDTFLVPVNGQVFGVGREIRSCLERSQELEQLDEHFAMSDGYMARVYGAFNYMLPNLPSRTIDYLMLGLPMTTLEHYEAKLSERFLGEHIINQKGDRVLVKHCAVYPQPLGGYATYLQRPLPRHTEAPIALIVDAGYNTVDWIACEGLKPNRSQSGAVECGMSGYLRKVAKSIVKSKGLSSGQESSIVRLLDQAMISGGKFLLTGKPFDIEPHLKAGQPVLEQAAQAVRNNVGAGLGIDLIIVSGGGAKFYAPFVSEKFPNHVLVSLPSSSMANVNGFQQFGEWIANSAERATPNHIEGEAVHA